MFNKTNSKLLSVQETPVDNHLVTKLEPKMFPYKFRERAIIWQRIYLFLVVLIYAIAIGVVAFSLLSGLAEKLFVLFSERNDYIILLLATSLLGLVFGSASPLLTRTKKYLFTLDEVILAIICPLIYIVSFTYISISFNFTNVNNFLLLMGIVNFAAVFLPWVLNLMRVIYLHKRYKVLLKDVLLLSLGTLLLSVMNLVFWLIIKTKDLGATTWVFTIVIINLALGILFLGIGVFIIFRSEMQNSQQNIWQHVRFTGALTTLVIYAVLATIGFRFAKLQFSLPVILSLVFNLIYLGILITYLYFRGWMKNVSKTNPIWNYVAIKLFTITTLITNLILIIMIPEISFLKDFSPPSFTILLLTNLTIVIGLFCAHISKLITYSRFYWLIVVITFGILFVVLLSVFSIILLKESHIILAIVARELNILFFILTLIIEILALFINLSYAFLSIYVKQIQMKFNNQSQEKIINEQAILERGE